MVGRRLVCYTAAALFFAGCASALLPPLPPAPEQSDLSEAVGQRQRLTESVYTLGPEDIIHITVYDHPDLSQDVTIAADGTFTYPFLGKFQAAGLTVQALEQQLTRRLADGYLVNPQLMVTLTQYRSQRIYVLGAVRTPGVYPLQHNATVVELLSQAGGVTPEAEGYILLMPAAEGSKSGAAATQTGQENSTALRISLDKLLTGQLPQPIPMASGDTIYVPLGGYFFVSGEVENPGRYRLERGMTVHKAITLAGGFSKFADRKRFRVKRTIDGESREYQAQLDDRLQTEDVLIINESIF
jgi:polysaccharide export outer membrane protein